MGSSCIRRSTLKIETNKVNSKKALSKLSKNTDFRNKYEWVSLLGNGAFGKVRLFRDRNCKELKYAIKTIKKEDMPKELYCFIIDEIKILSEMDHPNIVKYYETYEDDNYMNIVMEYLEGEDLFKLITTRKSKNFTEKDMAEIITYIFKALSFIHNKNIVHRDIKPENILFSKNGAYNTLKIIDFGLSTCMKSDNKFRVGSPYYMAPEIIHGNFSYKTDVWSVGVILYVMLTGHFPFHGKTNDDVFEKILSKPYESKYLNESKCSSLVKDLISKLLVKDQDERISVEAALCHPWFKYFLNTDGENQVDKLDEDIINSLKSFARKSLFQKEVMFYIAKLSKEEEIKKLKSAFMELDTDNTGTLDYGEIQKAFNKLGMKIKEDEIKSIWEGLDFHCDNEVNYTEFLAATLSSLSFFKEEKLWSAFKYFSENSNTNYITFDSVIKALKFQNIPINEEGIKSYFKSLKDSGIKLDFEAFKKIVKL